MKKMKKKIKKLERDAVRGKQEQQQRERVADDVIDRNSNQFPNFMALTKEEKLAFFESLHAARKNAMGKGSKVKGSFGTVHDEYLMYSGSVGDEVGNESLKVSSEAVKDSGTYESVCSSLHSEPFWPAIPQTTVTEPVETTFVRMNRFPNPSIPSIMSSKNFQKSKSLKSREDEPEQDKDNGDHNINPPETKSPKRKRLRDDNSDKVRKKSNSKFVTKAPKLKKTGIPRAQKEERKLEAPTLNKSKFETLKSDEKEILFSTLKEVRDNILRESPEIDNEIVSMTDIMKMYETEKKPTPKKVKVPSRRETHIKGNIKGKTNNLRLRVVLTLSENERTKKGTVTKRKEPSRKLETGEKEETRKGGPLDKDKRSKGTERKLLYPTDGSRKKQQREDNSVVTSRKPKEKKKKSAITQEKRNSIQVSQEACQDKRDEKVKSVIKSLSGKQEKKKIIASRRKSQKDKPKEKTEKSKKEISPKSKQVEQDSQNVMEEEENKEEKVEDDGKDKTERKNQLEPWLTSETFGEEVKCSETEDVNKKGTTSSMDTTHEEVTIEQEEQISIWDIPSSVKSEVKYQRQGPEPDIRQRPTDKSKSGMLDLRLKEEGLDNCCASHLVTSDEESVLQLWEELKSMELSDSDCMMETESMTAQVESENISQPQLTFLSKKKTQNKVHLAEGNVIVIEREQETQKGGEQREATVLDLLKSEGVIVIDGDAIEKIKNLVEALEKEAEAERNKKPEVKLDKENLENEYSKLLCEYLEYLKRLLNVLTNKREQNSKPWVRAPLTATGSHPEVVEHKEKKSGSIKKPRFLSDTNIPEDTKAEVEVRTKEPTLQGEDAGDSEVEGDSRSSINLSNSEVSSSEDDAPLVPSPEIRKKLIGNFLRERAKFVEESMDGFRIIKMAPRGYGVDLNQGQGIGQNRTKFKFFHVFSRFCECVRKKGSEEDQVQRKQP